jgi:glycosyltransferase involved in cell wall biosynthesis
MVMKILIVLNYYYPYISGLSESARYTAEKLSEKFDVTVLTSRHEENLKEEEYINGVRIIRSDILFKISKGYISPSFLKKFKQLQKDMDIVNLHLPMAEAGLLSLLTPKDKLVLTYQCDVNLDNSVIGKSIVKAMDISSKISMSRAEKIIVSSYDYANHSRVLPYFKNKWDEIHPVSPLYEKMIYDRIKDKNIAEQEIRIGFCGRIVEEKGVDVLLKAAPLVKKKLPNVRFLIAGDYKDVAGGSTFEKMKREIGWDPSYVDFLGKMKVEDLIKFYNSLDILVLPSINSLEAFGMVQVEAMLSGTPVIATDLPGVRGIVTKTGMGEIVDPGDVNAIAESIINVIENKNNYMKEKKVIEDIFGGNQAIRKYEDLFNEIIEGE